MIDPLNPRITLEQWSNNEGLRTQLLALVNSDAFETAAELLLNPQLPANMEGATLESIALRHQFEAGFFALVRGLKTMASLDGTSRQRMKAAQELNQRGPWAAAAVAADTAAASESEP